MAETHPPTPVHEECEWVIDPPPHRVLKLKVTTADIKNGKKPSKIQMPKCLIPSELFWVGSAHLEHYQVISHNHGKCGQDVRGRQPQRILHTGYVQ
mgnify:CR=1 FL=1